MGYLLAALIMASNASGKGLVRTAPGTLVPVFAASGPLIPDDSNTIAHVRWDGSQLVPVVGGTWTMNGTVPQVAKSGRTPPGAGPFTETAYYETTQANPAGDFSTCVVFTAASGTSKNIVDVGVTSGGYRVEHAANLLVQITSPGVNSLATPAASIAGAVNVFCVGKASGNAVVKLNLGTYTTSAVAFAQGSGATRIGRSRLANLAYQGTVHEVWFSTTTPSDALFTEIMQRVKLRAQITAW